MSKRHKPHRDNKPVTRRYIARTAYRLREDIIRAVLFATKPADKALADMLAAPTAPLSFEEDD